MCVNVIGGGYDFANVKPMLRSLATELSQAEMRTLCTHAVAHGTGVGLMASSLIHAVPNAISVSLSAGAREEMIMAGILDIIDKLGRKAQLLQSNAIRNNGTPGGKMRKYFNGVTAAVRLAEDGKSHQRAHDTSPPKQPGRQWLAENVAKVEAVEARPSPPREAGLNFTV